MNKPEQDGLELALQQAKADRAKWESEQAQHGKPKELSRNGYWRAPPEERPKGWENMGLKERDV